MKTENNRDQSSQTDTASENKLLGGRKAVIIKPHDDEVVLQHLHCQSYSGNPAQFSKVTTKVQDLSQPDQCQNREGTSDRDVNNANNPNQKVENKSVTSKVYRNTAFLYRKEKRTVNQQTKKILNTSSTNPKVTPPQRSPRQSQDKCNISSVVTIGRLFRDDAGSSKFPKERSILNHLRSLPL